MIIKKRIGIDCRMMGKAQATGIGNYIQQVVSRIIELDKENEYFLFFKPENFDLLQNLPPNATKIISNCHWYSLCEQVKFCAQLYKYNLDLVHFPQFNVPILYNRPFVVTIHDITAHLYPGHKMGSSFRKKAFQIIFNTALRKSRQIIAVSAYTKSKLIELFKVSAEKVMITHLGVEKDFLIEQNYAKIEEIKQRFAINKPYLFFVGVWRPHKNVVGLLKAFEILKKNYNLDLQLVLGGKEDVNYPEIRQTWESFDPEIAGDIIRPGFISESDLPYLYQGATAYVIPSFEEGFGLNGLEAMASGTRVISSNRGSLPEIYGSAAIYFNPEKPEEMAQVIAQTLENESLKTTLSLEAEKRLALYDWNKTAQDTLDLYRRQLNG